MSPSARILIADDDPTNIAILTKSLSEAGYAVVSATDGARAVEIANEELPDLILLDIMMPRLNGLEASQALKSNEATASIPVLFVTAQTASERIVDAFKHGGVDYITKPLRVDEVLARVSVHVRLQRTERELGRRNLQLEELAQKLEQLNLELTRQAQQDGLTKLLNRNAWEESARLEQARTDRHGSVYGIVMLDVDHFKALNDAQGHQVGDDCLRRIAECFSSECRSTDVIGRYGGEEFVILTSETDEQGVRDLAERIRMAVWDLALPHPTSRTADRITISLGTACSRIGSPEATIKAADQALYRAKTSGRNRVCSAHDPAPAAATDGAPIEPGPSAFPNEDWPGTVLVVDDDLTSRTLCKGILASNGYSVHEACDGVAALAEVQKHPPDVILMDFTMPRMDGLVCVRRLKASAATRDIPIVMVSARTDAHDIESALAAGADEYIAKPVTRRELEVRVRSMTRLFRRHRRTLEAEKAEAAATVLRTELAERTQIEKKLRQAKDAADESSRAKSEFLATMSHELRTPLNGVIGMTELLLGTQLDERQRRYASVARQSADTLLCLISDILDFSKIEAGMVELETTVFNIRHSIECIKESFGITAAKKGLKFEYQLHPQVPLSVVGDPARLQQVLINLIGNAIKFTERGQVSVRVVVEEETESNVTLRFIVDDTGIGIPRDRQHRLFQDFSQADSSTTRKYGGTGLGLAISSKLVTLMGGRICVESDVERGSTFWFTLKLAKAPEEQDRTLPAFGDLRRVLFLAVDDNEINLEIARDSLENSGLDMQTASQGERALALLREASMSSRPFGLALLVMQMPDMHGLQLAKAIKNDPAIKDTILILLTSAGDLPPVDELRAMGFAGCLTKPITQAALISAMVEALACATCAPAELQMNTPIALKTMRSGARLLLAEDNEIGQEVAMHTLAHAGYDCRAVSNGKEAVRASREQSFDLVLMDCQMPEMDGFQATRAIRERERDEACTGGPSRHIPIIALTANAIKGDRERCLEAGMDDYLTKPLVPKHLIETIDRYLSGSESRPGIEVDCEQPHKSMKDDEVLPEVADAAADHSPFDLDKLIKRWGTDRAFAEKMIRRFCEQAPSSMDGLECFVAAANSGEAAAAAHNLKGAASYVCAETFRQAAARLEAMAREGDLSQAEGCLKVMRAELAQCLAMGQAAKIPALAGESGN